MKNTWMLTLGFFVSFNAFGVEQKYHWLVNNKTGSDVTVTFYVSEYSAGQKVAQMTHVFSVKNNTFSSTYFDLALNRYLDAIDVVSDGEKKTVKIGARQWRKDLEVIVEKDLRGNLVVIPQLLGGYRPDLGIGVRR